MPEYPSESQPSTATKELQKPAKAAAMHEELSPLRQKIQLSDEQKQTLEKIYAHISSQDRPNIEKAILRTLEGKNIRTGSLLNGDGTNVEEVATIIDRISREVLSQNDWPLSRMGAESNGGKIESAQSAEIIVHPLYGVLRGEQWNPALWKECDKDIDFYLEKQLISAADIASRSLQKDPTAVPEAYVFLMEIAQEVETLQSPVQENDVRIFVMPRRSFLSPDQQQAMSALLRRQKNFTNVRVVDSLNDGTGELPSSVQETIARTLPFGCPIELKGGYWGGCLDGCLGSLKNMGRTDIPLSVNFDGATYFHRPEGDDIRRTFQLEKAPTLRPPSEPLHTTASILRWIHSNEAFNKAYKETVVPIYQQKIPKDIKVTKTEQQKSSMIET